MLLTFGPANCAAWQGGLSHRDHTVKGENTMLDRSRRIGAPAQDQFVQIRRYPTRLHLRCRACGRQSVATIFIVDVPRLKCRKCGQRNPIIIERDRTAAWARRRMGR
jgi:hypothetical protein